MPQRLGSSSSHRIVVFVGVVALIGVYIGYAVISRTLKSETRQGTLLPSAAVTQEPTPAELAARQQLWTSDDPVRGNAKASVSIIEFSDFECQFCERFVQQTLPTITEQYIATGKVKLVYRDFPLSQLHANAQKSAEAAECAKDQGKFAEMHDTIFQNQQSLSVANLKQYASQIGLNTAAFDSCLDSNSKAAEVARDEADGAAAGVSGTPSFFIGNDQEGYQMLVGAQPVAVFQAAIEQELSA